MDECAAHRITETLRETCDNEIEFYTLPVHSSHLTQPLDLVIFGAQKAHKQRTKLLTHINVSASEQTRNVISIIASLRRATTRINIYSAFRASCIVIEVKNIPGIWVVQTAKVEPTLAKKAQREILERSDGGNLMLIDGPRLFFVLF